MDALLADLESEFGEGRVFRPYRDVRFSRDKSPYKTSIAATLAEGGYIEMSADGLGAGCGLYHPASDQLERYRAALADPRGGAVLTRLVDDARAAKIDVTAHETLKTAPRGYPKDHPRIALLRQKGLITWRHWPVGAWLGTKKAEDRRPGPPGLRHALSTDSIGGVAFSAALKEVPMSFVQIIEFHSSKIDEIRKLGDEWEAAAGSDSKARRRVLAADRDTPGRYVNIVFFDSYEEAMENSSSPVTTEFAGKLMALSDAPASFSNLDVLQDRG